MNLDSKSFFNFLRPTTFDSERFKAGHEKNLDDDTEKMLQTVAAVQREEKIGGEVLKIAGTNYYTFKVKISMATMHEQLSLGMTF